MILFLELLNQNISTESSPKKLKFDEIENHSTNANRSTKFYEWFSTLVTLCPSKFIQMWICFSHNTKKIHIQQNYNHLVLFQINNLNFSCQSEIFFFSDLIELNRVSLMWSKIPVIGHKHSSLWHQTFIIIFW